MAQVTFDTVELISIHALREEGDSSPTVFGWGVFLFLSTPSARRATKCFWAYFGDDKISIHALREEGDGPAHSSNTLPVQFLSTPSARRATEKTPFTLRLLDISIHALREEGDGFFVEKRGKMLFLSTPSARRATCCRWGSSPGCVYFYPRPPRGGRRTIFSHGVHGLEFLSTPSARRATYDVWEKITPIIFLSTPSARRATSSCGPASTTSHISIHALREEGDR